MPNTPENTDNKDSGERQLRHWFGAGSPAEADSARPVHGRRPRPVELRERCTSSGNSGDDDVTQTAGLGSQSAELRAAPPVSCRPAG